MGDFTKSSHASRFVWRTDSPMSSSLSAKADHPLWRIELLGTLQLRRTEADADIVTRFRSHQAGALLAFLAFYRGRSFGRLALIEMLWPGCDEKAGRNRLSVVLSSLRTQLEVDGPMFEADRDAIALRADAITTDIAEFESCLKTAVQNPADSREVLARALKLYRGTLLPDYDEEWIAPQSRRIEEEFFRAARRLIALHREAGDRGRALSVAQRAVLVDPTREDLQRELIRLLVQTGQLEAARKQGVEVERVLSERLGCEPDATTRALLREVEARAQTTVRNVKSGSPFSVINRPAPLTRFFGRESDLENLKAWLQAPDERLITLSGSGGSGKTRLTIELGRALETEFPLAGQFDGGAWFIPLAEVSEADLLPEALRSALHLPISPGVGAMQQLVEVMSAGRTLLLLDNFEQLVPGGVAFVHTLLERLPQLKILVTSRHRLSLSGEREHIVAPLPLLVAESGPLLSNSAALFEDRARLAHPQFVLNDSNLEAVNALCARLDGLPLAIELAAARTNVLSPAQILAHLDEKFDLLVSNSADRIARHRTLRTALDWSFRLLPRQLQEFWTRLSVFRGGWSIEAARDVLDEKGVLDALSQLRDCSLVVTTIDGNGETRFSLLETLREFADDNLALNEREAYKRSHAEFYARFCEANARGLAGAQQGECLARLNSEQDNLRAALEWSLRSDAVLNLRLAAALSGYWEMRSRFIEGRAWLERTLDAVPKPINEAPLLSLLRAWVECGAGRLAWQGGDSGVARERLESCLREFRAVPDQNGQVQALNSLGWVAIGIDNGQARQFFWEAIEIARQLPEVPGAAHMLWGLIAVSESREELQTALEIAKERRDFYEWAHDERNMGYALGAIGHICYFLGERDEARAGYEASYRLLEKLGDSYAQSSALHGLGNLARQEGDLESARTLMNQSVRLSLAVENRWGVPHLAQCVAYIAIADNDLPRAAQLLGALSKLAEIPAMFGALSAPVARVELEAQLSTLKESLPPSMFAREWNRGRVMDFDAMINLALQVTQTSSPD
ncbi:putative HTH-type transcriptional regulator [Abditibacteriota bacterium]|nr:putative HTH-type transcriptional regulator [Abditibacteriota bacterium]